MTHRSSVQMVQPDELTDAFDRARQQPGAQTNFHLPLEPWWLGESLITCVAAITPANQSAAVEAAARGVSMIVAIPHEAWAWPVVRDLGRFGELAVGPDAPAPPSIRLNEDQLGLLRLLAAGRSIPDAANELFMSVRTAERRVGAARRALGVHTTAEAILMIGVPA